MTSDIPQHTPLQDGTVFKAPTTIQQNHRPDPSPPDPRAERHEQCARSPMTSTRVPLNTTQQQPHARARADRLETSMSVEVSQRCTEQRAPQRSPAHHSSVINKNHPLTSDRTMQSGVHDPRQEVSTSPCKQLSSDAVSDVHEAPATVPPLPKTVNSAPLTTKVTAEHRTVRKQPDHPIDQDTPRQSSSVPNSSALSIINQQ